jgi:subtilisin family serine protease
VGVRGRALTFLAFMALSMAGAADASAAPPVVAVLDSGVDFKHPALAGSAWTNPREIPANRLDDDGNGFVDDVHGADFVGRDGNPRDPRGHGTHVAGIVARGSGGGVRIMAVRIIGRDGSGWSRDLAAGIDYAVENGARVINLSVSDYPDDPAVATALDRASLRGAVVVAAAGNSGKDLDVKPVYPASYRTPGMIVVGAAGRGGRIASWSGRGRRSVDLVAPGVDVRSSLPRRRYGRKSGTSQAAAAVSGAVARALAAAPSASASALRDAVLGAADSAPALAGSVASGGVLDARGALAALRELP